MFSLRKAPLIVALSLSLGFSGCTSSTKMGATGIDRRQFFLVPNSKIQALSDRQYSKSLIQARSAGKLDRDPSHVRRLQSISKKIIQQIGVFRPDASNWKWEVHVIEDDMLNAYVSPNGKIMFFSGIIDRLALTDDEIAAIMGHEVSHALREHARESASRQMATKLGMTIFAAKVGMSQGQAELAGMVNQFGFALPHSRTQEREADVLGLELSARAGYNPNAAVSLWQKMRQQSGSAPPEFLSTHPSSTNRIKKLQELVEVVMPLYQAANKAIPVAVPTKKTKPKKRTWKIQFPDYKGG